LAGQGERRQVTTLVCSRVGQGIADDMQEQAMMCQTLCEPVFSRFGGRRGLRQGAHCMVYFGYPLAYEDAAHRAVRSALEMAAADTSASPAAASRIGIHTGMLLVGAERGPNWQERDLIGSALEVARDCQRQSEPGQVLITEDTRRLVEDAFLLEPLPGPLESEVTVKLYHVLGESGLGSRLDRLDQARRLTVFTGRVEEKRALDSYYEDLLRGKGRVVLVSGEPGIGKSRFLWELKKKAGVRWLEAHCQPTDQNTSLLPLARLLEQLLGFQPGDSPDGKRAKLAGMLAWYGLDRPSDAWLLSLVLGLPGESNQAGAPETITKNQREQMRLAFVSLLQKHAAEQPLVIEIEDIHWADPSTVEWLGRSLVGLASAPILALMTARPAFRPDWRTRPDLPVKIELGPLLPGDVEAMVAALLDDSGETGFGPAGVLSEEETRRLIVRQTDGIPLFVEELTRALLERSSTPYSGTPEFGEMAFRQGIPQTLSDSLMARLDRLGPAKETAQWAAVFGREFSFAVMRAAVPYEEARLRAHLARLVETDLAAPVEEQAGEYTFKHALVQEAAYESMLKGTRQGIHRKIAETYERAFRHVCETRPEIVGQHYAAGGLAGRAVDYWLRAGERFLAQGATEEALAFCDRALAALPQEDRERRWQALQMSGSAHRIRSDYDAQRRVLEALLALAEDFDDDRKRAEAYLFQARWASEQDFVLMLRAYEASIAAAVRAGERVIEVTALSEKVQALVWLGRREEARLAVEETLARLDHVPDEVARGFALGDISLYYADAGDLSRAAELMRSGVAAARGAGNRRKQCLYDINLGFAYLMMGGYVQARETLEEGMALAEAIGDRDSLSRLTNNLAYALWCTGERERAREQTMQSLVSFQLIGNRFAQADCLSFLGFYEAEAGEWALAAGHLAEARALYEQVEPGSHKIDLQAIQARCLLALGREEEARAQAVEAWAHMRERGAEGIDLHFPSRMYGCIADVFAELDAGASAQTVVETGRRDLLCRAEKISDETWRKSFLENVAENRDLMESGS
jgi:tetratricopeptide (TPR) repeat protein